MEYLLRDKYSKYQRPRLFKGKRGRGSLKQGKASVLQKVESKIMGKIWTKLTSMLVNVTAGFGVPFLAESKLP